ncbi:MAG: cytochrome P450 [Limibacillus sp.]|jgi:cytochrome P450
MHSPPLQRPLLYCPPRPKPLSPLGGLIRTALSGEGNLLSLLPAAAYKMPVGYLGYSRRSILIINDPAAARSIMTDPSGIYPKNDLMVGALEPLVGDSIFVSSGETWQRQRRMIDPAFTLIRINRAFEAMRAAVDDYEDHLDGLAESGETFSLDLAMSHLTADIICRTVFTTPLKSETAKAVYEDFALFERSVSHVELKRLIFDKPWSKVPQHEEVLAACQRIRQHLGELLDSHLEEGGRDYNDIASAIITARDPESGEAFTREELIDQLGVFFLAGHETTASVLTWVFFIAATQPEVLARLRAEVEEVVGAGEVTFEHTKKLVYTRNVFRETLRLYPPITFIPRVAAEATQIGRFKVKKGAMIMISPWTMHRHEAYWDNPHAFDPDRFSPDRESRITQAAYIPFGQGPRVCIGAAFATVESALILARLLRRFDFEVLEPEKVRPVARLTTRPAEQIRLKVRRAAG